MQAFERADRHPTNRRQPSEARQSAPFPSPAARSRIAPLPRRGTCSVFLADTADMHTSPPCPRSRTGFLEPPKSTQPIRCESDEPQIASLPNPQPSCLESTNAGESRKYRSPPDVKECL